MGGHLGCAQLLDPDPDSMSLKIGHFFHFLNADPIWTKLGKYVVLVYMSMLLHFMDPFLAHLAKGHMRYCHTAASVCRRLSSVVHNWEKMLLLLDGWMDLNQTWTQCSPSWGASGLCSVFGSGSGSESQKKCDKMWYTQNATPPRRLDGIEPNLGTMFP